MQQILVQRGFKYTHDSKCEQLLNTENSIAGDLPNTLQ
jgi:hypothetical protein